ncbi:MAG: endonuclease MutS2 [Clostridia bacterium]|nr:endonuclease MutS2 [Clostridia bacterium]
MAKFINRKSLKILEYDKILAQVANHTSSIYAKNTVLSIRPSIDLAQAQSLTNLTEQAYEILYEHLVSPSFSMDEMEDILDNASKFMTLSCADIIRVGRLLRTSRLVYNSIYKINSQNIEDIKGLLNNLYIDTELENSIYESILGDNEVSDNASPALKSIRQSIKSCNDRIRQKLNSYVTSADFSSYLQDSLVTMRNNRYVIPVKSEYVRQVKGLVHDQSASGATIYIEPMAIVEMNNELRGLCAEENNEIGRILQYFSQKITYACDNLRLSYDNIAYIDSIFAKARYSQEIKGSKVELNDNGVVEIIEGRHPLIDKQKVVPVSINLGIDYNTLLITGPNTGGKTVSLKLVGILSLMAASGIFPPCSGDSKLAVFENVFCDIGDEQNIEQNLSTFSSHITNLIYICNHVTSNCLLLLDELGGGTDPIEGSALAISLLEYFKNKGCKTITSTHYSELKEYSLVTEGIASAGMDFDPITYAPTYKLIMGHSSSSNALEIASSLGLKKQIVENARGRLSKEKVAFDNVIKGAEKSRRMAQEYEEKAKENYLISQKSAQNAKTALDELNIQKQKLEEKMRKGAKDLLSDYLEEADELLEEIKELVKQGDEQALFEARRLRKKLGDIKIEEQKPKREFLPADGDIEIGDKVFVTSLNNQGEVVVINQKKKECQVKVGILTTTIKLSDCQKIVAEDNKDKVKVTVSKEFSNKAFSFEINLIGQRVDEALYNLDSYLSEAIMHNCSEIRVVHGKGTGILRKAVQDYLKTSPIVDTFRLGKYGEGESGVTIVTLK